MSREIKIKEIKQRVFEANLELPKAGLVKLTWGNVSEVDRELEIIVIKPSGVDYDIMKADDMVITDLEGNILEGDLNPSSDLATHVVLYNHFKKIKSIVHTHSKHAVMWAQAGRDIPAYGTTHADTFYGDIPCARPLSEEEIVRAYEVETGNVIVETFEERKLDPLAVPGIIISGHGPFCWGESVDKAVSNSIVLDEVAEMAYMSEVIQPDIKEIPQYLLDKHYFRKHGENAYYGQTKKSK